ncbi:reverse transcriptase [Senna tora]|uniref:Reverse transcriptase n=1 Tax=Senna tora TaxID=362788 RepID=A0A834T2Y8_9FABA|nr:reverse transcriptase [Senna tora]
MLAREKGFSRVVFESDCLELVQALVADSPIMDWRAFSVVEDIRRLSKEFSAFSFSWIPRSANQAADWVAVSAAKKMCPSDWVLVPPSSLALLLSRDRAFCRSGVAKSIVDFDDEFIIKLMQSCIIDSRDANRFKPKLPLPPLEIGIELVRGAEESEGSGGTNAVADMCAEGAGWVGSKPWGNFWPKVEILLLFLQLESSIEMVKMMMVILGNIIGIQLGLEIQYVSYLEKRVPQSHLYSLVPQVPQCPCWVMVHTRGFWAHIHLLPHLFVCSLLQLPWQVVASSVKLKILVSLKPFVADLTDEPVCRQERLGRQGYDFSIWAEFELLVKQSIAEEDNWCQFRFCCLRKHWLHLMQKSN